MEHVIELSTLGNINCCSWVPPFSSENQIFGFYHKRKFQMKRPLLKQFQRTQEHVYSIQIILCKNSLIHFSLV